MTTTAVAAAVVPAFVIPTSWVRPITTVEFVLGMLACLVFMVAFHIRTHGAWRTSSLGRNVMLLIAALFVIMLLSIGHTVFGDYPGRERLVMVLFGVYTAVLTHRILILEQLHRSSVAGERLAEPPREEKVR